MADSLRFPIRKFGYLNRINFGRLAGLLLFCMIVLTVLHGVWPGQFSLAQTLAGVFAWSAAAILFIRLGWVQKLQISLFLCVGLGFIALALYKELDVSITEALSRNAALVTMLLSVGFLKLVLLPARLPADALPVTTDAALPVGRRAYLHTLLTTALFGSIINISAPVIIGDRLTAHKPMSLFLDKSLARIFCACATWSPFFAGMAVVVLSVEAVRLPVLMLGGFPFMVMAIVLTYWRAVTAEPQAVAAFEGYPLKLSSLSAPALLAVAVMTGSVAFPAVSILVVIAVSALLLSVLMLLRHGFRSMLQKVMTHILDGMPQSVNEVLLFLAAGVLASGLVAITQGESINLPVSEYSVTTASTTLALMILVAACGIHPVIQISVITPVLLTLQPQPELLALTFLLAWGLGTLASPLSGTHLVFQGRYGIPAWRGALQNLRYVGVMYLYAIALLWVFATAVGTGS